MHENNDGNQRSIILAGAAPDTGNLGVSALCYSTVANLLGQDNELRINILGHGKRSAREKFTVEGHASSDIIPAKHTLRVYDPSSFINIRFSMKFGLAVSRTVKCFKQANALLDISGGDSFTDLYGKRRFDAITLPKTIAIENKIPLILLPQTYGPFLPNSAAVGIAQNLIKKSTIAYARDQYSFEYMKELLGEDFNPEVHKLGVDVAFLLPATPASEVISSGLAPDKYASKKEIYGINVSGLIFNDLEAAKKQYGIKVDYRTLLTSFIRYILKESDGDVWFVPHVLVPFDHYESDAAACESLKSNFSEKEKSRIKVISGTYDQCEIKGVIGLCDWFTGTRMHSTVGSLSQCVPTAAIAYSGKTKGVFATAGQGSKVFDAREESTDNLLQKLIDAWKDRAQTKLELERDIPLLKERALYQFSQIISQIPR